jgi:hypothetical protein
MTTQPKIIAAQTQFDPFTSALSGLVPASGGGTANFLRADGTWQPAGGGSITISNDVDTDGTRYPTFAAGISGSMSTIYTSDTKLTYNPWSGTLSATVMNTLSDRRMKENIRPLENSFYVINQLKGMSFTFIDSKLPSIGLIAQDVEEVIPEIVDTNKAGIKSINYPVLVAHLIEYVKLLNARIEALEHANVRPY